ncbi:MAG: flagellar assembly protein FliH [Sporolactobacillus sp.]
MSNLLKSPLASSIARPIKVTAVIDPALDALTESMSEAEVQQTLDERINAAKEQAARLINEAAQQEQAMRQQMAVEAEQAAEARSRAFEEKQKEGFDQGYQAGAEAGEKAYLDKISQANQWIDRAHHAYLKAIEDAEPNILKLSLAVAEKIIATKLDASEQAWQSLVEQAVKEVREQGTIKITVAPDRYVQVSEIKSTLDALVHDQQVYLFMDSELSVNDCRVTTDFGRIDAGVKSQLSVIETKLRELLAGESE